MCVTFNADADLSGNNAGKWTQLKNTLHRNVTDKAKGKKKSRKHPFLQKKFKVDIILAIYETVRPNIRKTYAIAFFADGRHPAFSDINPNLS